MTIRISLISSRLIRAVSSFSVRCWEHSGIYIFGCIVLYWLYGGVFTFFLLCFATTGVLYRMEDKLLYYPEIPRHSRVYVPAPSTCNLPYQSLFIRSIDGTMLHMFFIPQAADKIKNVPTILFLHGNAGNIGHRFCFIIERNVLHSTASYDSEKSVEAFMASTNGTKRMKIPNLKHMDSFSETDSEIEKKKYLKRKANCTNDAQKNILKAKLAKMASASKPTITSIIAMKPGQIVTEFEKTIPRSSEKMKELSVNINELASSQNESNMVDRILEKESSLDFEKVNQRDSALILKATENFDNIKENEMSRNHISKLKSDFKAKEVELKRCKIEIKKLKTQLADEIQQRNDMLLLNMDLQRTVIGQFLSLHSNLKELTSEVTEVAKKSGKECADKISAIKGDEIHLGRNVWIKKTVYDAIRGKSRISAPLFVKEMALAVFGTDTLLASTVTGKTSNRSKSKTTDPEQELLKLDPVKLMAIGDITFHWMTVELKEGVTKSELVKAKVGKYISHKISEMKRSLKKCEKSTEVAGNNVAESQYNCKNDVSADNVTVINRSDNGNDNRATETTDKEENDLLIDDGSNSSSESDNNSENRSDIDSDSFRSDNELDSTDDINDDDPHDNHKDPLFIDPLSMDYNSQ